MNIDETNKDILLDESQQLNENSNNEISLSINSSKTEYSGCNKQLDDHNLVQIIKPKTNLLDANKFISTSFDSGAQVNNDKRYLPDSISTLKIKFLKPSLNIMMCIDSFEFSKSLVQSIPDDPHFQYYLIFIIFDKNKYNMNHVSELRTVSKQTTYNEKIFLEESAEYYINIKVNLKNKRREMLVAEKLFTFKVNDDLFKSSISLYFKTKYLEVGMINKKMKEYQMKSEPAIHNIATTLFNENQIYTSSIDFLKPQFYEDFGPGQIVKSVDLTRCFVAFVILKFDISFANIIITPLKMSQIIKDKKNPSLFKKKCFNIIALFKEQIFYKKSLKIKNDIIKNIYNQKISIPSDKKESLLKLNLSKKELFNNKSKYYGELLIDISKIECNIVAKYIFLK